MAGLTPTLRRTRAALPFALLGMLALAGCQVTRFEHPPLETGRCDPDLVGTWVAPEDPSEFQAELDASCRLRFRNRSDSGLHDIAVGELQSGSIGAAEYLWFNVRRTDLAFEVPPHESVEANDVYILRYGLTDGELTVWPADHRRIAHLLIDGKLKGTVEYGERSSKITPALTNRVRGDHAEIRALIEQHAPFTGEPMRLQRAAQPR